MPNPTQKLLPNYETGIFSETRLNYKVAWDLRTTIVTLSLGRHICCSLAGNIRHRNSIFVGEEQQQAFKGIKVALIEATALGKPVSDSETGFPKAVASISATLIPLKACCCCREVLAVGGEYLATPLAPETRRHSSSEEECLLVSGASGVARYSPPTARTSRQPKTVTNCAWWQEGNAYGSQVRCSKS